MAMMVILAPSLFAQPLNKTPIGFWRFEINSSVAYDYTGNGHNGTITGATHQASKGTNETGNLSIEFSGTSPDRVSISQNQSDFTFGNGVSDVPFSVGAWVYMDDATNFRIASKRTSNADIEWSFFTNPSDQILFRLADNDDSFSIGRSTNAVTSYQGTWVYLVGTYDGSASSGGINIYINGVISDNADSNSGSYTAMQNENVPLDWGVLNVVSISDGKIDEAFVIGEELSQMQIQQAMNYGWNLTEGAGGGGIPPAEEEVPLYADEYIFFTCPLGDLTTALMFMFFFVIVFFLMAMAYWMGNGLLGGFSGLMMMFLSFYLYTCIFIVGITLTVMSIFLMFYFIHGGWNGNFRLRGRRR